MRNRNGYSSLATLIGLAVLAITGALCVGVGLAVWRAIEIIWRML